MNFTHIRDGVVVPMVTPFTADGAVDLIATERLVDRFIRAGVGAFVLGTTGETASIPRNERVKLVEQAVRQANGKIPVYAGIGDNCLAHSVEAARRYLELGVDAVVAHLPSYYPLQNEEMIFYFQKLHDAIPGPIMIYNIPQTTSMSLPMDIVEKLAELPNFVGFKDSERCLERMNDAVTRFRDRRDFSLFMGSAVLSAQALEAGFDGLVPGSGNLFPELWRQLYDSAKSNDWAKAKILQIQLDEVATVFQKDMTLGQSLAALKFLMHESGLCEPYVLPPLRTLNGQDPMTTAALVSNYRNLQCLSGQ